VKLRLHRRIAAQALFIAFQIQAIAKAGPARSAPQQHFVCDRGYTEQECAIDVAVLHKVLAKYPSENLHEWTWVLVRPKEWKRILRDRKLDPDLIPAFTYLPDRVTFFESALVRKISLGSFELSARWHMPIENLLDLAVRHEIAHALCQERNEAEADRIARVLQQGGTISCRTTTQSSGLAGMHRK
jgi:hypothetical protein